MFSLSLKRAARDWRLREIRLLLMALTVAVLAVTSISFFTDRVDRAMRLQGAALLGADLLIQSSRPLSEPVRRLAAPFTTTEVVEFRSVILSGNRSLLTEVKAVGEAYPLRGALQTSLFLGDLGSTTASAPRPGEAWAAAEVFYQLGLTPGSTIQLGNSNFTLKRILNFEPDAGGSVFRFAPRLMINLTSLADTGLITPASRATYKLLISGEEKAMLDMRLPLQQAISPAEVLQTVEQGRPEINAALNRAVQFMKLASVLTIIIAGAAVALTTISYTRRERHTIAILKTLGATRSRLWQDYTLRFVILVLIATLIGSMLGLVFQFILAQLLAALLNISLPAISYEPLAAGLATAMLTLSGFALPSILGVIQTPPMRVMRAETARPHGQVLLSIISISMAMAGFLFWQAGEFKLAAIVFAGLVSGLGLMMLISWLITRLFQRFHVHRGSGWQLGLANIGRYGGRAALLVTTIGIGIFALSLLGGVRQDLVAAWENRIPDHAPNHFMINIQGADLDALNVFLKRRKLENTQIYPMIRGRLRAINGTSVRSENFEDREAKNTLNREINLTTSLTLPTENTILAGHWFKTQYDRDRKQPALGISVESELANGLGVTLNDTLEFDIGGRSFSASVTSLRQVQWDTMQPNFYIIAAPGALDDYPTSYITAVHIGDSDTQFTTNLVAAFPSITVLDVRAILKQIRRIIAQVSNAVEVVFAFSLLAGIIVLLAAIQTQRNERRQEIAILKTLGASQRQIKRSVAAEFMMLGALAGTIGTGMALLTGWVLAEQVFDLRYQVSWQPVAWGIIAGVIGMGGVGYGVIRKLIRTPPTRLLQEF